MGYNLGTGAAANFMWFIKCLCLSSVACVLAHKTMLLFTLNVILRDEAQKRRMAGRHWYIASARVSKSMKDDYNVHVA